MIAVAACKGEAVERMSFILPPSKGQAFARKRVQPETEFLDSFRMKTFKINTTIILSRLVLSGTGRSSLLADCVSVCLQSISRKNEMYTLNCTISFISTEKIELECGGCPSMGNPSFGQYAVKDTPVTKRFSGVTTPPRMATAQLSVNLWNYCHGNFSDGRMNRNIPPGCLRENQIFRV
ncbi:hypothetical protein J6590_055667 [Homalodisca vitripennis]|nr:hypothetical protein J6590_055667 [Homalodisca vitripennis]